MKRVSFEVAKAIKEAGYPQDRKDVGYVIEKCSDRFNVYYEGELTDNASRMVKKVSAPYVMEVWLWLWREKGFKYEIVKSGTHVLCIEEPYKFHYDNDPEEATLAAIDSALEYLTNKK